MPESTIPAAATTAEALTAALRACGFTPGAPVLDHASLALALDDVRQLLRVVLERLEGAGNPRPRLLTTRQVAARLGVTRMTLWHWRQTGVLRPREIPGRGQRPMRRYALKDIEAFERNLHTASD